MVEYQHPAGAGCLGDEAYGFGIIDAAQLVLVIEVLDRAAMLDMSQPFTVEREATRDRPCIMNQHDMRFRNASRPRHSGRRVIGEVYRLFRHRREVIQKALDMRQPLDHVTGDAHRSFLRGLGDEVSNFSNTISSNSSKGVPFFSARSTAPSQVSERMRARWCSNQRGFRHAAIRPVPSVLVSQHLSSTW